METIGIPGIYRGDLGITDKRMEAWAPKWDLWSLESGQFRV